jgi:hypothetical protein
LADRANPPAALRGGNGTIMKRNDSTLAERVLLPIIAIVGVIVAYLDLFIWRPL